MPAALFNKRNPFFKLLIMLFVAMILLGVCFLFYLHNLARYWPSGTTPQADMHGRNVPRNEFVIGDLGGVPVRIPAYFANDVEYDGDPHFLEKRTTPIPVRTYQSRLRIFGFEVRFPDMAGRSSRELWSHYNSYFDGPTQGKRDNSISPWISVYLLSGSNYPGDGFLDRYIHTVLRFNAERDGFPILACKNYTRLDQPEYGLTAYAALAVSPKTNEPCRKNEYARDLFVHRNAQGDVDTYIKCSGLHLPNRQTTSCEQIFSMTPDMRAKIHVRYTRSILPQWREIQHKMRQLILSFKTDEATLQLNAGASSVGQR